MSAPAAPWFLTTERLGFRAWRADDQRLAQSLWGEPRVMRFLARAPLGEAAVRARLAREMEGQRAHGIQYWPVFRRGGEAFVGCCGLRPRASAVGVLELGFHLVPDAWGQGLASEAARAVTAHGFGRLHAAALFAGHHPENHASRAVLLRLGFRATHDELYEPTGLLHPCYLLPREAAAWAAVPAIRLLPATPALLAALDSSVALAPWGALVPRRDLAAARGALEQSIAFDARLGATPPWTGRLAVDAASAEIVGQCGFKGNPSREGEVEIAYFTYPSHEGRGYGTAMAQALVGAARRGGARTALAHTLRERDASCRILGKAGFSGPVDVTDPEDGPLWRWTLGLMA